MRSCEVAIICPDPLENKEAELRQQSLVAIMLSATPKIKPKPKQRVPPLHGKKNEVQGTIS